MNTIMQKQFQFEFSTVRFYPEQFISIWNDGYAHWTQMRGLRPILHCVIMGALVNMEMFQQALFKQRTTKAGFMIYLQKT